MDDLLELVMDVLLEGAAETAASPKAPLRVRIILILILGIGFFGVAGLIFWVDVYKRQVITWVVIRIWQTDCPGAQSQK